MKSYVITVNGVSYDVTVEEKGADPQVQMPVRMGAPVVPMTAPQAPAAAAPAASSAGAVKINAPMPGKILSVKLENGAAVKKGDVILVLEAMKMENEIVAPQDGTIASVNVIVGEAVEAGAVLATMN